jgi:hypothetical protein
MTETLQTPVRDLTTGSTFAGRHQVIEELGKGGMGRVTSVLGAGYARMLRDSIRYWDGTAWTAEPTMCR